MQATSSEIERLMFLMQDLYDSADNVGCEEPLMVCDGDRLLALHKEIKRLNDGLPGYVLFSPSEAANQDDKAGYWSNIEGWTTFPFATVFLISEKESLAHLPSNGQNDTRWVQAKGAINEPSN